MGIQYLSLFGNYLDHMLVKFEQNRMVQTIQNFELFVESVDAILEDVFVTQMIIRC